MAKITKEDIQRRLARKYDLPLSDVREATESQFKFVAHTIKHDVPNSVRLRYLGQFRIRGWKLKQWLKGNNDEDNK